MSEKKKKSKVYLFESSVEKENRTVDLRKAAKDEQYPLGLLYLDAVLKKNNYEVSTKFYTTLTEEECLAEIKREVLRFKPDFVGITVMSMTRVSTYKAIKLIKKIDKNIRIILGGIHPSLMYGQLLENFPIDAVCIGDAEESFIELLDAIINKKSLRKVKGIAFKDQGKVIVNPLGALKMDLDDLPYPSHDIYMNPKIKRIKILSSRGCPNKCSFCCMNVPNRRVWRPRNYMKVVDEIEYLIKKYPWIESIFFLDDTMTLDNQRMIDMCKEIIKRGIRIRFDGQGRIKPISREMIYWMEKAGFKSLYFGIESGNEEILRTCHKNITKAECIHAWKILGEFPKIEVEKCLMVGLPGETEETINETINFVKQLRRIKKMHTNFYAQPLWVFPGTEVYEITKAKGAMNDDYWLTDKPVPFFTIEHSERWLMKMSNRIVIKTMIDHGLFFFLKKLMLKALVDPKHYLKRILTVPSGRKLQ
jgi:radical SAM superfamily enzyme YgiQ (UPF0313 family)